MLYYFNRTLCLIFFHLIDFRYYEDPSDSYRGKGEGTLMQMWKMIFDTAKTLFVTDISWSPDYFDMFAVSLSIRE